MARTRRLPSSSAAVRSYLDSPVPRVFAHRGLAIEAPENTLLAFASAVAIGTRYIETDVHGSHDGVAVISHDPTLERVANRRVRVSQLTMAELRKIDLGYGQGFPSLAEALDAFPETKFNIDVKSRDAVPGTIAAITKVGAQDRVLVSSFDERRRALALRGLPNVVSSASARRFLPALLAGKIGFSPAVRGSLRGLVAVQVPERALGLRVTTARMIRALHAVGVEVHVWTVNDPRRMNELLDLGVDGIVTDRADLALQVLDTRGQ
jgi:glycerophosphoryl diester phosphodiesterase